MDYLPAFTVGYVQGTVIPRALHGRDNTTLLALSTLFALMGIGALFAMEGPTEAEEVAYYGHAAAEGIAAMGVLAAPSLEMIQAIHARSLLEFFRQGSQEEPTRCLLAIAALMCWSVCASFSNDQLSPNFIYS
jgi:hypothetical protein